MASGARKWLVGCGIGCGLMILAVGGIGTCGYLGVRNIKDRAERLDAGFEAVTAEYGRPDEFTPPADGVVPAGRLELFLEVRGVLAPSRNELGAVLVELDAGTEGGRGVLNKIRAGISLLPRMLDFIDERNQVLLDRGMGVGEYTYIYSLAYYAWLDKDPGDGPDFAVTDHGDGDDGTSFRWEGGREDPGDVREQRRDDLRRQLNRLQAAMLANQLEAARAAGADAAWLEQLAAEAEALDMEPDRLMWQAGLPAPIVAGLEPYREQLDAAYLPVMNVVEMGLAEHD